MTFFSLASLPKGSGVLSEEYSDCIYLGSRDNDLVIDKRNIYDYNSQVDKFFLG